MARKRKNENPLKKQLSLIECIENNERIQKAIKFLLQAFDVNDLKIISKGTVLEKILKEFDQGSDIPLELPFICFITAWSAYLNEKETHLYFGKDKVYSDIWNVILADSGSGKSYTLKKIKEILDFKPITYFGTAASFIKNIAEQTTGKGLLIKDEFAEFLRQLESHSYLQELKEYLLQMYSNERIERLTKKETYIIEKPIFSIIGATVKEAFIQNINPIMLIDGFLQRFCILIAQKDQNKNILDYLVFTIDLSPLKDEINSLKKQVKELYELDTEMFKNVCLTYFNEMILDVDNSYIRRYLFRVVKYSLLFHTLMKPDENVINIEAIMKASVLTKRHIIDLKNLLNNMGMSELEKKMKQAENLKNKLGRNPTIRELIAYCRGIKNVQEAKAIYQMVFEC